MINSTQSNTPITVAYGDGIGPEIMEATIRILEAGGARLAIERIEIGESLYKRGFNVGIEPSAWESLRRTKVFLKAPITTPQGGGFQSLNVTVRKTLGLFANIRPCVAYHPFVQTKYPGMDVVIVRENEEDLYAGIEYRLSDDVFQCLKLISEPGCEKIVRYAFEYARLNNRSRVTCFTKDNIMKMTDGIFHKVFDRIAAEYKDITAEHWIVDIGAAKLAATPQKFDVIVMPNLYGDILSDVAAQIAGSVGLAGSANIGEQCAMFEAIHGSAPRVAGQNAANPSGLFHGAVMMLVHIGQADVATRVHNAWLRTIEDGVHTYDVYVEGKSARKVGTKEFADAVIERIGQQPEQLKPVKYKGGNKPLMGSFYKGPPTTTKKVLGGVDVYLQSRNMPVDEMANVLVAAQGTTLKLSMITNRGVKVWPDGAPETFCTDSYRCRFLGSGASVSHADIVSLLQRIAAAGMDFVKTENLSTFDGQPGYSLGQGE